MPAFSARVRPPMAFFLRLEPGPGLLQLLFGCNTADAAVRLPNHPAGEVVRLRGHPIPLPAGGVVCLSVGPFCGRKGLFQPLAEGVRLRVDGQGGEIQMQQLPVFRQRHLREAVEVDGQLEAGPVPAALNLDPAVIHGHPPSRFPAPGW